MGRVLYPELDLWRWRLFSSCQPRFIRDCCDPHRGMWEGRCGSPPLVQFLVLAQHRARASALLPLLNCVRTEVASSVVKTNLWRSVRSCTKAPILLQASGVKG